MGKVRERRVIVAPAFEGALTGAAGSVGTDELADDCLTSLKQHETIVKYAEVSITAAEVKAIRATPISLVAAEGADKIVEFLSALLILEYGSEVLAESSDNLAVRYTDGSGAIVSEAIEAGGFLDQSADTVSNAVAKKDNIVAASGCVNKALVLHNTGDGEITGNATEDSVLRVKIAYRVHTAGL